MVEIKEKEKPYDQFVNVDYASLSDWLFSFTGYEYGIVGAFIGLLIAAPLNINQQNSIGNFFELVGQMILTINAQEITRRAQINANDIEINQRQNTINNQNNTTYNDKIASLEQEIIKLKEEISKIRK